MRLMKGYDLDYKMHLLKLYDKSERDFFLPLLEELGAVRQEMEAKADWFLVQGSLPAGGKGLAQVKLLTNLCQGIYMSDLNVRLE